MKIAAEFVISAASARDFPRDGLPEIAFVGRSNVGKSSLINALVRQRLARTSAAPGKTRLANVYRVQRGAAPAFYLVDLPGYGYARGGEASAREFEELTRAYFGPAGQEERPGPSGGAGRSSGGAAVSGRAEDGRQAAALLLVDARHPGLASDLEAWRWLLTVVDGPGLAATKIDKLARGERMRAQRELESVFQQSVLPVSAVTGEGLDELWKLIDRLANSQHRNPRPSRAGATAPTRALPRR